MGLAASGQQGVVDWQQLGAVGLRPQEVAERLLLVGSESGGQLEGVCLPTTVRPAGDTTVQSEAQQAYPCQYGQCLIFGCEGGKAPAGQTSELHWSRLDSVQSCRAD